MLASIRQLDPVKDDELGRIFGVQLRSSDYFCIIDRKKGTVSGAHYHLGKIKSKNPETFYLAKGEIRLELRDIHTGAEEEYILKPHQVIEIPPNIYHAFHALTDIILIEFNNSGEDYASDTVKESK